MNNLQLSVLLSAIDKMSAPTRAAAKSVNELSAALKISRTVRAKLVGQDKANTAAIEKYRTTLNPLKNKLGEINQTLLQAQQKAKHFEQQLLNAKNPTAEFKAKVEQAKDAVKKLKDEQTQVATKLKNARVELQRSGISAGTLGKRQEELRTKLKGANAQIKQQEASLKALNLQQAKHNAYRAKVDNLKEISGKAQMLGAQSMAAGATITTPIASSVNTFMSFEDAMIGVARQVQGLKDRAGNFTPEFDAWKLKIQGLSKELPLTTVQIANMIESAARMDVPNEQLEDFVRLNTQMATAFDAANPDELTENFGKVSKNWNLSIQSSKELADSINYLDDNAISKGDAIIGFMNRLGGIGAMAKITDKNVAAMGSTLMTFGSDESSAANAVSSTFSRLSRSTSMKPVKRGLNALGLDARKIQTGMVKDAQGTLMTIIERIKTIPEHLRSAVLTDIVGGNYGDEMMKLVANTEEWRRQIALANSEMAKGSMAREFDTRMKALSSSWAIFKNQAFNLNATLGGLLALTLKNLMDKIATLLNKTQDWINANPVLAENLLKIVAVVGSGLTAFGALSLVLSFLTYPIARIALGFANLNEIFPKSTGRIKSLTSALMSWKQTGAGAQRITKFLGGSLLNILNPITYLKGAVHLATGALKGFLFVSRFLITTPLGLIITGLAAGALYIYKNWEKVRSFFGGFWEGLKAGLAPVIEKFKPLGDLFGVVVGWIEKAVKWFTDLLSPVQSTQKDLDSAASAGKKFGEWVAKGIELALTPLNLLMDGIKWVINNMPSIEKFAKEYGNKIDNTAKMAASTGFSSGGYVGNGGKYQPMGIVHGGEYVITKEATSRLGVPLLNALNYGKKSAAVSMLGAGVATAAPVKVDNRPMLLNALNYGKKAAALPMLGAGGATAAPVKGDSRPMLLNALNYGKKAAAVSMLGAGVATAAPVKVDNRPPLIPRSAVVQQVAQPMTVNININAAAGQDERTIARLVVQELQRVQQQQQARMRSRMTDNE